MENLILSIVMFVIGFCGIVGYSVNYGITTTEKKYAEKPTQYLTGGVKAALISPKLDSEGNDFIEILVQSNERVVLK